MLAQDMPSEESPRGLHTVSTPIPSAWRSLPSRGCLYIRTPVPEMKASDKQKAAGVSRWPGSPRVRVLVLAGQSPWRRLGVSRHQNGGRAFW